MDALALTRRLLTFDTCNPPGREAECARFLAGLLEAAGFRVEAAEFAASRTNLIADLGDGARPPICFSGHLDTVPVGETPWTRPPFEGRLEGDTLYGRGVSDMKSGVGAMVAAALQAAGAARGRAGIRLILTAGEETGCDGAFFLARSGRIRPPVRALVVGEPTANYPCIAHKGVIWLQARAQGRSAHGSMPELGDNAIYKAAAAIGRLQSFSFGLPAHPVLGSPTLNVGTVSGGAAINIVPDHAAFTLDVRTIPGPSHAMLRGRLQSCAGPEIEFDTRLDCPPVATDPGDPWVAETFARLAGLLKTPIVPRGLTYFTDASALAEALGRPPVLIFGPGDPARIHKPDETCSAQAIATACAAYTEMMLS